MFVGRVKELELLQVKYESNKAEFIVMYGRRRIGKTELIREFVKDKKHIFYSGHQINNRMQLKRTSDLLVGYFKRAIYSDSFETWEHVFQYISDNLDSTEKTVLVLDEFPYMVESDSSIPSVLQSMWDHYLSEKNIMLILCGSALSFMERDLLGEKNPLYGRATGIMKIGEMVFDETKPFYPNDNIYEQMTYYSIFSGVPYYLKFIDKKLSLKENVINNVLQSGSVLFSEVEFLLKQELREVITYNTIITAIAMGHTKQNEIVQLTGIEKTKLPYYLNSLMDIGIITKEFPSTVKAKEMTKSRKGLYILENSFFRFYYRFVYPYLSELSDGNADIIYEEIIDEQLSAYVGTCFEKVSIQHIKELNNNRALPIRAIRVGRWWKKDVEIDIVAYDVNGNYLFGECKWKNKKVSIETLNKLREKSIQIAIPGERYYILYSKSGFTEQLKSLKDDKVILIESTSM